MLNVEALVIRGNRTNPKQATCKEGTYTLGVDYVSY